MTPSCEVIFKENGLGKKLGQVWAALDCLFVI